MSIENKVSAECDTQNTANNAIALVIAPNEKDLGEFVVRRTLPSAKRKLVGPWIFFDHFGPTTFPAGSGVNVRPHPHINLATVSYLFEGEILHRDSLGSYATINPGDINLMVAGKGIVHSEREREDVNKSEHKLHGLQLWLALPEKDEEIDPAFYHYPANTIPVTYVNGVAVRILMGSAYGLTSPVLTYASTLYVEAFMTSGQTLEMPEAQERAIYVVQGSLTVAGSHIVEHSMVVLSPDTLVSIEASTDTRLAIIGGENVGKRYVEWNFISSRKARIEQAKQDWREGKFAKVEGDEEEFIPY
ncbi:pirin family protein [Flavobacterium sp. W21_SRS_FM6]|uniref:pirin family protein n=1 Tax=Flavobacterium sp. W21_SRS_FM6 TaxID=3240268 RepID=UPI003F8DD517